MAEDFAPGKLPHRMLQKLLDRIPVRDPRVVVGPGIGEDAAVIDMGDHYMVAKTDPITFATDRIGWYCVHVNANDVATSGAAPRWFLATALLPEQTTDAALVETVFAGIREACDSLGIALVGGHTEITFGIDHPILVGQMLGEVAKDRLVRTGGAAIGDRLLVTKGIPLEGTSLIARERGVELIKLGLPPATIAAAAGLLDSPGISVVREALLAVNLGQVHAMHDPTEGGLATGLWELAEAAGVGLRVDGAAIPVLSEGQMLCAELGLDLLGTIASGALVIAAPPGDSEQIREGLLGNGIPCADIGEVTPRDAGCRITMDGVERDLPVFVKDEITRILGS